MYKNAYTALALGIHSFMLLFLEVAIHTVLENRPRGSYNSKIVRVTNTDLGKII